MEEAMLVLRTSDRVDQTTTGGRRTKTKSIAHNCIPSILTDSNPSEKQNPILSHRQLTTYARSSDLMNAEIENKKKKESANNHSTKPKTSEPTKEPRPPTVPSSRVSKPTPLESVSQPRIMKNNNEGIKQGQSNKQ